MYDEEFDHFAELNETNTASAWRWLLVLPVFAIGYVLPGLLVRVGWEFGTSWIPFVDDLIVNVSEFLQSIVDGVCSVYFAAVVAPSHRKLVAIIGAMVVAGIASVFVWSLLLTNYYEGVPGRTVTWEGVLVATGFIAAGATSYWIAKSEDREFAN